MHGRDHLPDGPDPIPGLEVGGGTDLAYVLALQDDQSVAAGVTGYLNFFSIFTHPGDSTTSGTSITIPASGMYDVHGVGRLAYGDTDIDGRVIPEVNGSTTDIGSVLDQSVFTVNHTGSADFAVGIWTVTIPLMLITTFDVGDILKFQAQNLGAFALEFATWKIVVRQLS